MANTKTKTNDVQSIVEKRLKAPEGFFKWIKNDFPIYEWSNKSQTIISSDRKEYTEKVSKRLTKKSRLTFIGDTFYYVWMGVTNKRIEMQMYQTTQKFVDGKEEFNIHLFNFYQLANGKMVKAHYNSLQSSEGCPVYAPGFQNQSGYMGGGAFTTFSTYGSFDTLVTKLATKSELKYLDWNEDVKKVFEIEQVLPHIYKYRDRIEYAQNIKARGLVKEMLGSISYYYSYYAPSYRHANMGRLTMNFLKANKPYLKNSDITFDKAAFEIYCRKAYGKVFPALFEVLTEDLRVQDTRKTVENYLKDSIPEKVRPVRFIHWLMKNNIPLSDYRDYVEMVTALGLPFEGDYIVLPKNWEEKHKEVVENYSAFRLVQLEQGTILRETRAEAQLLKERENSKKRKETAKRLKAMLQAQTTFDHYAFILPSDETELVMEGKTLHHCVGSYTNKHFVDGSTTIIFVRDKDKLDQPLYTLEMKNHEIVQLRGEGNKDADEIAWAEARQFLAHCDELKLQY